MSVRTNAKPVVPATPIPSGQTLLTVQQAAEFLQVSFWTLLLWRKQAKGPPYIKVGHFIRYAEGDLIDWLQSNKIRPTMQGRRASVIYE